MGKGINYAGHSTVNMDVKTGIRYGVISSNDLNLDIVFESFENDYGAPTCGNCGNEVISTDEDEAEDEDGNELNTDKYAHPKYGCDDYVCHDCECFLDSSDAYGDEAIGANLDDGEYIASMSTSGNDIFVIKSPYYTRAEFCSPCAPGACHLSSPCDDGDKAYCFGHDWFEDGKAPYKVYRVSDDSEVKTNRIQGAFDEAKREMRRTFQEFNGANQSPMFNAAHRRAERFGRWIINHRTEQEKAILTLKEAPKEVYDRLNKMIDDYHSKNG